MKRWMRLWNGRGSNNGASSDTLSPLDIKNEDTCISPIEKDIMTTENTEQPPYIMRLVRGRKVYSNGDVQLAVWTKQECEERIDSLFASQQNHYDFLKGAADWVVAQDDIDEMHGRWAGDCLNVLYEAYERREATFKPEADKPKQKLFASLKTETRPKPKPKLFGVKK